MNAQIIKWICNRASGSDCWLLSVLTLLGFWRSERTQFCRVRVRLHVPARLTRTSRVSCERVVRRLEGKLQADSVSEILISAPSFAWSIWAETPARHSGMNYPVTQLINSCGRDRELKIKDAVFFCHKHCLRTHVHESFQFCRKWQ